MNFYLIDPNLAIFIVTIFLRRLYYHVGCKLISKLYSNKSQEDLSFLSRGILTFFFAIIIGTLATIVIGGLGKMYILYMSYPITVYLVLFGFQIRPFFEVASWCSNGIPAIHACSSNPNDIRKECEHLRFNLNDRVRQILFTSVINAYYGGWIPCAFAPGELVYDIPWCFQHGVFIFTSTFVFSLTHLMPLKYCDIMHRAALHSGMWEKMDHERNLCSDTNDWRDDILWPSGVLVRYEKLVWKSLGDCNSIKPGDKSLTRYYKLFILPSQVIGLVLGIQILIIFYQLFILVRITHWFKIVSLAIMLFFNYYPLYKVCRDFLVGYKIYKHTEETEDEKDVQSELSNSSSLNLSNLRIPRNPKTKTEEQKTEQERDQSEDESSTEINDR